MRVVLDTNVIVSAIRSTHGAAAKLLLKVVDGELDAAVTLALALEYEMVALRPEHLAAGELDERSARVLLDGVLACMSAVTPHLKLRPSSSDPKDDMVVEAAVNANADVLVTGDARHLAEAAGRWGLRVAAPKVLLSALEPRP